MTKVATPNNTIVKRVHVTHNHILSFSFIFNEGAICASWSYNCYDIHAAISYTWTGLQTYMLASRLVWPSVEPPGIRSQLNVLAHWYLVDEPTSDPIAAVQIYQESIGRGISESNFSSQFQSSSLLTR